LANSQTDLFASIILLLSIVSVMFIFAFIEFRG
jgi:hypothetical protein